MRRPHLVWRFLSAFSAVVAAVVLGIGWHAASAVREVYCARVAADLESRVRLIALHLPSPVASATASELAALCEGLGAASPTRLTVILPSGEVVADSEAGPAKIDNRADRPEITEAFAGRVGVSQQHSRALRQHMLHVSVPIRERGAIVAVLRASVPVSEIHAVLSSVRGELVLGGGVIVLAAALAGLLVTRRLAHQFEMIAQGAKRFAQGDLGHHIPTLAAEEAAGLAEAMNEMAAELDKRLRALTQQRGEHEALLSSMVEAVLAVDARERVIMLNRAAGDLFGVDPGKARGRILHEVVWNPALHQILGATLRGDGVVEAEVVVRLNEVRFLQAHGTPLRDAGGHGDAALIVLNDVTRLRRLETVRRDFVANVSHELKTPITSIKGFVATLRDGAVHNADEAERFLAIVEKHADGLNAIIEDLLALSRIEQEEEGGQIALERGRLRPVIAAAVRECLPKADSGGVGITVTCADVVAADINAPLLQRALVNLIDNAVKYSLPDNVVRVQVTPADEGVVIHVRDRGCGIEPEHLPRLFERFYRVDKARSRKLGGTGLGLAIVKHIAQAHGGRVSVESTPGEGSAFCIHLPQPQTSSPTSNLAED